MEERRKREEGGREGEGIHHYLVWSLYTPLLLSKRKAGLTETVEDTLNSV